MICNDCQGFWDSAASSGAIRISKHDDSIEWSRYSKTLHRNAADLEMSINQATPRCSICVCAWYSLTESERKSLSKKALPLLDLHFAPTQTKPTLRVKFVDEDGTNDEIPTRTVAIFDRESNNGMAYLGDFHSPPAHYLSGYIYHYAKVL
jgi:hypothetical protein